MRQLKLKRGDLIIIKNYDRLMCDERNNIIGSVHKGMILIFIARGNFDINVITHNGLNGWISAHNYAKL